PRLTPMKLVFKTGSNKYPTWTIPTEIIPAVDEELSQYKLGTKTRTTRQPANQIEEGESDSENLLAIERKIQKLTTDIVNRKREINIIFRNRFDTKFFNDNEIAIFSIMKPCGNEENFTNLIQSLCVVLDDVDTASLRKKIEPNTDIRGSIDLMELLIKKHAKSQSGESIKTFRAIRALRSKKFPAHKDDGKFIEAMKHFGIGKFPPDWQVLWENVLQKCATALTEFRDSFQ
ncbi:MAG: hypothetical protein ACREBU_14590, partial [Nitrososphaera sp.]